MYRETQNTNIRHTCLPILCISFTLCYDSTFPVVNEEPLKPKLV
jgi:hypothetical protein